MPTFNAGYRVAGTKTGRLASSKLLGKFSGNVQNVSDDMRRIFVPRPGHKFIQNDLEGAEAVAVALLVSEGNFRELVRRKVKIHNFVCVFIFPWLFEEFFTKEQVQELTPKSFHEHQNYKDIVSKCKKLKVEYGLAKKTVHMSNYSAGWKTFQESILQETGGQVVLPAAECKRLLNAYFTLFPEVKVFQATADKAAQEFTEVTNLFNWSVRIIQRYTTAVGRTAISWAPQSTVGVATILAASRYQDYIERNEKRWNILNIVHDSILSEAPAEEAEEAAKVLADCMTFTFTSPIDNWQCTIGVEKSVGDNWSKWDPEENPSGMKVIQ